MIKPQVKRQFLQFLKGADKEREYMRYPEGDSFSRGCCRNWCSALCGYRWRREYWRTIECLLVKNEGNDSGSSESESNENWTPKRSEWRNSRNSWLRWKGRIRLMDDSL